MIIKIAPIIYLLIAVTLASDTKVDSKNVKIANDTSVNGKKSEKRDAALLPPVSSSVATKKGNYHYIQPSHELRSSVISSGHGLDLSSVHGIGKPSSSYGTPLAAPLNSYTYHNSGGSGHGNSHEIQQYKTIGSHELSGHNNYGNVLTSHETIGHGSGYENSGHGISSLGHGISLGHESSSLGHGLSHGSSLGGYESSGHGISSSSHGSSSLGHGSSHGILSLGHGSSHGISSLSHGLSSSGHGSSLGHGFSSHGYGGSSSLGHGSSHGISSIDHGSLSYGGSSLGHISNSLSGGHYGSFESLGHGSSLGSSHGSTLVSIGKPSYSLSTPHLSSSHHSIGGSSHGISSSYGLPSYSSSHGISSSYGLPSHSSSHGISSSYGVPSYSSSHGISSSYGLPSHSSSHGISSSYGVPKPTYSISSGHIESGPSYATGHKGLRHYTSTSAGHIPLTHGSIGAYGGGHSLNIGSLPNDGYYASGPKSVHSVYKTKAVPITYSKTPISSFTSYQSTKNSFKPSTYLGSISGEDSHLSSHGSSGYEYSPPSKYQPSLTYGAPSKSHYSVPSTNYGVPISHGSHESSLSNYQHSSGGEASSSTYHHH